MTTMSEVQPLFKMREEAIAKYKDLQPPFGILGAPTFKRTYARNVEDADGNQIDKESFLQTIVRVIEGNVQLGIENNDPTATNEWAEEALEYFFKMAVIPPGRGLWMMGTDYARLRGGDALNNCWYTNVEPSSYEDMDMFKDTWLISKPNEPMVSYPFVFTADRAMLGGGVGFGLGIDNISKIPTVSTKVELVIPLHPSHPDWERIRASEDWDFIKDYITDEIFDEQPENYIFLTDDREGWNVAIRETIDAHFTDKPVVKLVIDHSRIRQYNTAIKGFGGTASGPEPLISGIIAVNRVLNARVGKKMRSVDALDIMNIIGRIVVSGNVRRTALIALGDADDSDYVEAKNYTLVDPVMEKDENGYTIWETNKWGRSVQKRRPFDDVASELGEEEAQELFDTAWKQENHRWASNNSVYTHKLFDDHHFIAAGIIANGEPGMGNKWLMENFGRIKDGFQEGIDSGAIGLNPCGEITLHPQEPCNLVEILPLMVEKSGLSIKRALEIGTQYTYRITFAKYIWKATQRVIEKNRRIGVSLTGMQDYFLHRYGHYALKEFEGGDITKPVFHQSIVDELDAWYGIVKKANHGHAISMNATPSNKVTTNKPSGTVAKLPGVSSGIHWHYSPFMIQRIRFHETDPNLEVLRVCGFPIEKAAKEPNTVVVEFPIKNPNAEHPNFKSSGDITLEEQFANQYLFAYAWADNAVSATLTFKPDEHHKIEPLLKAYNNKIKSTSLLPYTGHGYVQAPWEPITEEEYNERSKAVVVKPEDAYKYFKFTKTVSDELLDSDCVGGSCPIR